MFSDIVSYLHGLYGFGSELGSFGNFLHSLLDFETCDVKFISPTQLTSKLFTWKLITNLVTTSLVFI